MVSEHDNVLLDQMTSALGERGALVEFEDSLLFLQIVIVISIFYALFPLQVHLLLPLIPTKPCR